MNGQPATVPPGASDDVLFSSVEGTELDCATNGEGTVSVNSITIDSSYTGTLTLNDDLDVGSGGFTMEGGNIDQPMGASSDISVMGFFNWSAGNVNLGNVVSNLLLYRNAVLTGTNLTTGDNVLLFGTSVALANKVLLASTNNAGATLSSGAAFNWDRRGQHRDDRVRVVQQQRRPTGQDRHEQEWQGHLRPAGCQERRRAVLDIQVGTLGIRQGAPASGVLASQLNGTIQLGTDNVSKGILEVDQAGRIKRRLAHHRRGRNVRNHGREHYCLRGRRHAGGSSGIGELDCDGKVVMNGGADRERWTTASQSLSWEADLGFQLGGSSALMSSASTSPPTITGC